MLEYIHAHPIHPTLQELSDHFGFSPSYIGTLIKRETGQNFMDLVMDVRICHAKKLLKEGKARFVSQAEEAQLPPALNYAACKAGLDAALEDAVFALAMSGEKELLLRALALFALGQRL